MHRGVHPCPMIHLLTTLGLVLALAAALPQVASAAEAASSTTHRAAPQQPAVAAVAAEVAPLPLPQFTPCTTDSSSLMLPEKWGAVALMQDFLEDELNFGRFVYDDSVRAFRFTLANRYGQSGDYLLTQNQTLYQLFGGDNPTQCTSRGTATNLVIPSRDWLGRGAVCVGEAKILERDQMWWKVPSGPVGGNWFWFDVGYQRLPFRTMFYAEPTGPAPIYEYFTFNYFPTFVPLAETEVPRLLAMCQSSEEPDMMQREYEFHDVESLLGPTTYPEPSPETIEVVQRWIPGLTECRSTSDLPPPWPEKVEITTFFTAVKFSANPFPSRVYYDWSRMAQNSSLYYYPPPARDTDPMVQVALLTGEPARPGDRPGTGFIRIVNKNGQIAMCEQALPGPQVPNWMATVNDNGKTCECRAQIAPGTVLNPSSIPTKILWCPTDLSQKQVFWTWYSDQGHPVVFMQSNSSPVAGTGLNLADYTGWRPGTEAPSGTFEVPAVCRGGKITQVPKACHNCHLPVNRH